MPFFLTLRDAIAGHESELETAIILSVSESLALCDRISCLEWATVNPRILDLDEAA